MWYGKYLVLKTEDLNEFLTEEQKEYLSAIIFDVSMARMLKKGKSSAHEYLVVNSDEPYAHIVRDLIEQSVDISED